MKISDLATVASVALGTAALTVAVLWAPGIEAGNDETSGVDKIEKPKLLSHGVEVSLVPAHDGIFAAGDQPEFRLTAVNTSQQPATVPIQVLMTVTSPADALSRVVRLPTVLWQDQITLRLTPGETRRLSLATKTKLPAGRLVNVSLREAASAPQQPADKGLALLSQPGVVALSFATAPGTTTPELVAVSHQHHAPGELLAKPVVR